MDEILFLTLEQALEIHVDQLKRYGGSDGIIDLNVVDSAVQQARASMFGQYLHADLASMAAAYLFHFAAAQGFVDGNKRTGAASAVTFLAMNGFDLACMEDELYDVTMAVANHELGKSGVADWIAKRLKPIA